MRKVLHLVTGITSVVFSLLQMVGFIIIAFVITSFDELGTFPETLCDGAFICIHDRPGGYALIQAVLSLLSLTASLVSIFVPPKDDTLAGYVAAMYLHVALATAAAIFLVLRLYNMGLFELAVSDVGCKNPDLEGSPFERYERYGNQTITGVSQCVFNAFDTTLITHSNTVLDNNSTIQKLDWSNPDTFKQAQRGAAVAAANSVGGSYTNVTLPYYYESYYWGCSSVCTADRYDANMMFLYLTIISLLFHIAAIPLNLAVANSKEAGTVVPQDGDNTPLLEEGGEVPDVDPETPDGEEDKNQTVVNRDEVSPDAAEGDLRFRRLRY